MSKIYHKKLKELVKCSKNKPIFAKCRKGYFLGNLLLTETNFLIGKHTLKERLWYIEKNLFEQVRCLHCNNITRINIKTNKPIFCSSKCARNYIDNTGLSEAKQTAIKNSCKINYKKRAKKATNTRLTKIDIKSGLPISQIAAIKAANTMKKIGLNGKSIYEKSFHKTKKTLSKINPETGLTKAQEIGLKSKQTKLKINPKTGLSIYQENAKKFSKNINKINPKTGLSKAQEIGLKSKQTIRKKDYDKLINNFPIDYKLITNKDEYCKYHLITYKHKCGEIRIKSGQEQIRCLKCYPYNKSIAENEILEFCKNFVSAISNSRFIIKPLELDIYIPNNNLAIEYDGLFWHSSYSTESENKDYHLLKSNLCQEKNIQLLHIFENEWENPIKQEIWKSIIKNKLNKSKKIFARKCKIKEVSPKDSKIFLNINHLQGNCPSSTNLGLFYNNKLVSLMTFGKSRFNKKIDWELLRFCNKLNYSVVGAASRLFKNFLKEHTGSIVSYADMRRSTGNLYKQLGFELSHESGPNYWYFKDQTILESRIKYQKHKLKDKLEKFDENLTESENMYLNGYRKIFDCGNQVWIYSLVPPDV